jgi:hypothetical protein
LPASSVSFPYVWVKYLRHVARRTAPRTSRVISWSGGRSPAAFTASRRAWAAIFPEGLRRDCPGLSRVLARGVGLDRDAGGDDATLGVRAQLDRLELEPVAGASGLVAVLGDPDGAAAFAVGDL